MEVWIEILPWLGLAIAAIGLFVQEKGGGSRPSATALLPLAFPPVVLGVAAAVYANFVAGDLKDALFIFAGAAGVATLVSIVGLWRSTSTLGGLMVGLGLAAFVAGFDIAGDPTRLGGLVAGFAAGALPAMGLGSLRAGVLALVLSFSAGVTTMIAKIGYSKPVHDIAVLFCFAGLLGATAWLAGKRAIGDKAPWIARAIGVIVAVGLSWSVAAFYLGMGDLGYVVLVAAVASVASAMAIQPNQSSIVPWGIAAVIWLGVATYAFSQSFGLGMSVAGLTGLVTCVVMGRLDLLPAIGIPVGLSYYRLFRENNSEIVQAFDIGQHYALIGFVLGVVAVLAVADGIARRKAHWGARGHIAAALIGLGAVVVVVGAAAFFGTKGAIGTVVGLSIAPIVARMTSTGSSWTLAAAAALQSALIVSYRPLAWDTSLDRDGKLKLLWVLSAIVVGVFLALWALERTKKEANDAAA